MAVLWLRHAGRQGMESYGVEGWCGIILVLQPGGGADFTHLQRHLTNLPLDKMTAISQTIFSDALSWMQSFVLFIKKITEDFPFDNISVLV